LHLSASSKVHLNGFYDPCIDEPKVSSHDTVESTIHPMKQLKIRYLCMGKMHEVTIDDEAPVRLPMRAHLLTK
jgi:hypothetical protein